MEVTGVVWSEAINMPYSMIDLKVKWYIVVSNETYPTRTLIRRDLYDYVPG